MTINTTADDFTPLVSIDSRTGSIVIDRMDASELFEGLTSMDNDAWTDAHDDLVTIFRAIADKLAACEWSADVKAGTLMLDLD